MTAITYQGIPCVSVVFRRSRGYRADTSSVVIPINADPANLRVQSPSDTDLSKRPKLESPSLADLGLEVPQGPQGGGLGLIPGADRPLDYEGTLVMAEKIGEQVLKVEVPGLVVIAAEIETRDEAPEGEAVHFLRLTLADERYFWARGVLPRWSFNRQRLDGTIAKDSVRVDGALFKRSEVLKQVVKSLWRAPELADAPPRWFDDEREANFPPFAPAVGALEQLCLEGDAEAPCLHLGDGAVAVHEIGDGRLAYAPGGVGVNSEEIPAAFVAWEGGTGHGHSHTLEHVEDYALVVGPPRIATVAIDDLEPVVMIEGQPQYLSEELVRELTGGRKGLKWLRTLVLLGAADAGVAGVAQEIVDLLHSQAYRLWRLPGVELLGSVSKEDAERFAALPADDPRRVAAEAKGKAGFYNGLPGPNAHLLPILPRAETSGGSRESPTLEAPGFKSIRTKFKGDPTALDNLRAARDKLRDARAALAGPRGIFSGRPQINTVTGNYGTDFGVPGVTQLPLSPGEFNGGELLPPEIDRERLQFYLDRLRRIEAAKSSLGDEGSAATEAYAQALAEEAKALDAKNGTAKQSTMLELAKELVQIEKSKAVGVTSSVREKVNEVGDAKRAIRDAAEKLRPGERERRARERSGLNASNPIGPIEWQNLRRRPVTATVESAELGVFSTSEIAGHLENERVHVPSMTSLKPCPVRAIFGAALRPRVDVPPNASTPKRAGPTGSAQQPSDPPHCEGVGGDNVIPKALTDQESHFVAAFKRSGTGAVPAVLSEVPLDRALRIERPDLRELVPLKTSGNREALEREAREAAAAIFRRRSEVKAASYVLVGPWPIQCDGVVAGIEIRNEVVEGAPCGFTTTVSVGGSALLPRAPRTLTRGVPRIQDDRDGRAVG